VDVDAAFLTADGERRRSRRFRSVERHGIVSSRVRPGTPVAIVDISAGGALVETEYRLLPGASVELQMKTSDRTAAVRGRVLRSAVVTLGAQLVRYRGAIGFECQPAWKANEQLAGYSLPGRETRPALHARADPTHHMG
jgi:hypothetical protein